MVDITTFSAQEEAAIGLTQAISYLRIAVRAFRAGLETSCQNGLGTPTESVRIDSFNQYLHYYDEDILTRLAIRRRGWVYRTDLRTRARGDSARKI